MEAKKRKETSFDKRKSSGQSQISQNKNLPSLELDFEMMGLNDNFSDFKNLREYLFNTGNFLEDFDEARISKRLENLSKFCVWKMKKWKTKDQRYYFIFLTVIFNINFLEIKLNRNNMKKKQFVKSAHKKLRSTSLWNISLSVKKEQNSNNKPSYSKRK